MMELSEKLQILRKKKGLTQEELAQALYVSRTAISKWESGRGYPSIDSLKAISRFFSVSIDELLSGEEALTIAEEDNQVKQRRFRGRVFALLDISAVAFLLLPLFGQEMGGTIQNVSLTALAHVQPYLKTAYFLLVIMQVLLGALALALQKKNCGSWPERVSLMLGGAGCLLFIASRQPYAAAFSFLLMLIKVLLLTKNQ